MLQIAQLPLGWNPPIEELLVATRNTRESFRPPWAERVAAVSGLNTIELYGIMEQLVYVRAANRRDIAFRCLWQSSLDEIPDVLLACRPACTALLPPWACCI